MNNKRILITGINGFVGSHLADLLAQKEEGMEIYGTIRGRTANLENLKHLKQQIKIIECDITDAYSVNKTIEEVEPDFVFHLAAQAFVPASWRSPIETMNTNVIGSMNLFEALRKSKTEARIQIAGSSEEYGLVLQNETPITEKNELRPLSPYGVSKCTMDLLGYQYFKSYGMKIVRTRAFNHTGPRRGDAYVCSNWCKQVAEINAGKQQPTIMVGNLEAKRDFTDVRDIVRGYALAAEKGKVGEVYNLCSGKTHVMKDILEKIKMHAKKAVSVKEDPARLRPSDVMILLGDYSKFNKATGWKPEIPFDKTLEDLFAYWEQRV
ncbi:MAG: GDP-mannose 4,6-dehydratase [Candidatus Diapherotrites archaeon]